MATPEESQSTEEEYQAHDISYIPGQDVAKALNWFYTPEGRAWRQDFIRQRQEQQAESES